MALPKLNTPTYELEVPSTDDKIKYPKKILMTPPVPLIPALCLPLPPSALSLCIV